MKISLNWLKDYIDLEGVDPKELGLKFTMASAEIEGVENLAKDFDNVVTAKILEIIQHPDADKLRVTKVDNGKEVLQVVCGAPNIEVGQIVPLAQVGAVLPGDFKIKVSNKRGVESLGMLCSSTELGVDGDGSGILILPEETSLGLPFADLAGKNDSIIEIDNKSITHRPDLWGHYGIAREMAAIINKEFKKLDFTLPKAEEEKVKINVEVQDSELCKRYTAIAFEGVEIKDSPDWMKQRLLNIGSRPINNVVDVTNYIMFELGQPLHSFDGEKIKDNTIIVRKAVDGEKITTLDEVERNLTSDMLVIADPEKPIAIAGVMGNQNSEVDENTKYVVLEVGNFHPASVRRTALKLGLRTEASARFEKSLDPEMTVQAVTRFYQLLKETCPNLKVVSSLQDIDFSSKEPVYVEVKREFINRRLGIEISKEFIETTLKALGFEVNELSDGHYKLKVPTYRATKDIGIPEDIVEEIGRVYGYDNIPPVAPKLETMPIQEDPRHILRKKLREQFSSAFAFKEVYNYSFNGSDQLNKLKLDLDKHIKLLNPLAQDQEYMRTSLVPNMLNAVSKNLRNFDKFGLYELGKAYFKVDNSEKEYLCAVYVEKKPSEALFYNVKTYALETLKKLNLSNFDVRLPEANDTLEYFCHPARTGFITQGRNVLGYVTEIHPRTLKDFDINGRIGMIYFDLDAIQNTTKKKEKFKDIPKYPHVPFDISVLTDKKVLIADVLKTIEKVNKNLIRDIKLFDIYEGKNIPEDKKSLAFTINFYSKERTLDSNEIKDLQNGVMKALNDKGYEVRGS
jgi:phenylalanyl-tRNA synthetase beta chain